MTHGINKLINLLLLLLPRNNILYYTIILGPYTKFEKFHTAIPKKKKSLKISLLVGPYIFNPLYKVSILEDYNPMNYDK